MVLRSCLLMVSYYNVDVWRIYRCSSLHRDKSWLIETLINACISFILQMLSKQRIIMIKNQKRTNFWRVKSTHLTSIMPTFSCHWFKNDFLAAQTHKSFSYSIKEALYKNINKLMNISNKQKNISNKNTDFHSCCHSQPHDSAIVRQPDHTNDSKKYIFFRMATF